MLRVEGTFLLATLSITIVEEVKKLSGSRRDNQRARPMSKAGGTGVSVSGRAHVKRQIRQHIHWCTRPVFSTGVARFSKSAELLHEHCPPVSLGCRAS